MRVRERAFRDGNNGIDLLLGFELYTIQDTDLACFITRIMFLYCFLLMKKLPALTDRQFFCAVVWKNYLILRRLFAHASASSFVKPRVMNRNRVCPSNHQTSYSSG